MPELEVAGRKVRFSDAGSGEPVVLLHASSSSSAQWRALSDALLARGNLRVLAIDLQGYGGSASWDPHVPLRLEDEFGPIRAVLAHVGNGPVHLVGHSYGGMIALRFALAEAGPHLLSLTLAEPVAFWLLREAGEDDAYAEARTVADTFVRDFDSGDVAGAVAPYIDYWSGRGAWEALPEAVKAYAIGTAAKPRREWAIALGDTEAGVRLADLERLRTPTLLIRGERSNGPTRRIAELLHAAIPGARMTEIPGAGHMAPLSHPGPVNTAIGAHVAQTIR